MTQQKNINFKIFGSMVSCVLKYKDDILLLMLSTLLLSFPSALENGEIAEIAFVSSFFHSLAWSILILWVVSDYKYLKRIYFLFLFFLFFLDTSIYFLFGSRLDSNIVTLIMQTDFEESKEFFISYLMTWKSLVCLILFICMGGGDSILDGF